MSKKKEVVVNDDNIVDAKNVLKEKPLTVKEFIKKLNKLKK